MAGWNSNRLAILDWVSSIVRLACVVSGWSIDPREWLLRLDSDQRPVSKYNVTGVVTRHKEYAGVCSGGLSNAEIASRLFLSERTVETHLHVAYSRLNIASRIGLTAWAMENLPNLGTGTDTEPGP